MRIVVEKRCAWVHLLMLPRWRICYIHSISSTPFTVLNFFQAFYFRSLYTALFLFLRNWSIALEKKFTNRKIRVHFSFTFLYALSSMWTEGSKPVRFTVCSPHQPAAADRSSSTILSQGRSYARTPWIIARKKRCIDKVPTNSS